MDNLTNEQLAARYMVSTRTIARMKADGIDPQDPVAVASWLVSRRSANAPALERITYILETELPS